MFRRCLTIFFFLMAAVFVFRFALAQRELQTSTSKDSSQVFVQPPTLHQWGAVTLFHGLPSDRVRAIAQTDDGVMWFGTDSGLAKYDGRRTQAITSNEITQTKINALSVDENKTLWIGTDGGIVRFSDGRFKLIKETEGRVITAFLHLENNRTLAASEDGFLFDIQQQAVKTIPREQLQSADVDNPGALEMTSLANVNDKIFVGSHSRGVFTLESDEVKEVRSEPRGYFVEALETDGAGNLFIGARASVKGNGLYDLSDAAHPKKLGAGLGTVLSLRSDKRKNLWVGTDSQGVFQFRDGVAVNQFTFDGTAGGLRSNRVFEIFVDLEDVVWFGTDRGVSRYDPKALRVERLSENPESNFIRAIYRAKDGALYCGTNRGLFVQRGEIWRQVFELAQKTIYAIDEDAKGRLLVGTANGLFVKDKNTFTLFGARPQPLQIKPDEHNSESTEQTQSESKPESKSAETKSFAIQYQQSNDSVRAIAQLQNKTYVANFGRGVEVLEGENQKLVFPRVSDDSKLKEVNTLFADSQNRLWIGTATKGVFIFDGANSKNESALSELQNATINSFEETEDGAVWFATSKGLYTYKQNKLTNILPNQDVRSIKKMADGKSQMTYHVWSATADGGVVKIIINENQETIISTLDAEQGLPSQKTFALLKEENVWLIGTNRGLARYETNSYAPVLQATRAIGKREYAAEELKENLPLEYPQNSLVFEVSAISSRTFPEQFQYAFTLLNEKNETVQRKTTRDSQFSTQGLKAGKYRVEVVAYNADLTESKPLTFEFTVASAPFPFTTALLTLLLLLAAAALLWAIFEHRRIISTSAALVNANQELADARLRLANEAESERRRIARDLHDQTLADLRRLMLMSDQLKENGNAANAKINPATFRNEIENVSNEIRRICEDLSPSVLENVGFSAALEFAISDAVAHLPEEKRFEFEFYCEDDLEERLNFAPGVTMQIYRIAQEAISNICRHSNAKNVRFETAMIDDVFVMKLEDDGNGFDLNSQSTGRGLANIAARASLIDADVEWVKGDKEGMVFILKKENSVNQHPKGN